MGLKWYVDSMFQASRINVTGHIVLMYGNQGRSKSL